MPRGEGKDPSDINRPPRRKSMNGGKDAGKGRGKLMSRLFTNHPELLARLQAMQVGGSPEKKKVIQNSPKNFAKTIGGGY